MNQISTRVSGCCRSLSSLLRKNAYTRSPKPISFSSSANLTKGFIPKLHNQAFNCPSPPPQIPGNHDFRKFSGEASRCNFGDDDYLKNEIWDIEREMDRAQGKVEMGIGPPLDAVKDLADKFDALMEKLYLEDIEKAGNKFRKNIENIERYADMTVAFGEFVAAGGDRSWQPFMSHYRRMLRGEGNGMFYILGEGEDESSDEMYRKIVASLLQMKLRSRLMRRLRESQILNQQ